MVPTVVPCGATWSHWSNSKKIVLFTRNMRGAVLGATIRCKELRIVTMVREEWTYLPPPAFTLDVA